MSPTLYTSRGAPLQVGKELGKGGEGSVFELPSNPKLVAKVYHKAPDGNKQSKLSYMASVADDQLLSYVAWPQETLHAKPGGPVTGFLMTKVAGRDPVHVVYSPAHRRQERPNVAWDFLLFAARNIAAAFDALHSHGHVLGDVNQGNVLIGHDSKAILIDSDSFQVNANGHLHLCEVGVGHFTPPELQGISSFDGVKRTPNHDNFGLALLIFHLLFGGRHPFAGVPLRNGVGDQLETDIKGFKYAYARDAQARGLIPPPRSIPLSMMPSAIEAMFHLAFTEKGAGVGRPAAKLWVRELDAVRKSLKKCGGTSMHVYPEHVPKCPWCDLERQGVLYFLDLGGTFTATASGFVLARAWALIEAVQPPPPVIAPNIEAISAKPTPLPVGIPGNGTIAFYRLVVVVAAISLLVAAPRMWLVMIIGGFIGWNVAGNAGGVQRRVEQNRRRTARDLAFQEFNGLVERLKHEAGPEGFSAKRAELKKLHDEYQRLPQVEKQEIDKLHATAHERQKAKFLDSFFIDRATIPGVGAARKSTLRSFGIETAADVSFNRIRQVRGFGESLTRAVVDWRASCERRFTFNPNTAVSEQEKNTVRSKIAARKTTIEATLNAGAGELSRFRQQTSMRLAQLTPQLEKAAKKLAQANQDLRLLQ